MKGIEGVCLQNGVMRGTGEGLILVEFYGTGSNSENFNIV